MNSFRVMRTVLGCCALCIVVLWPASSSAQERRIPVKSLPGEVRQSFGKSYPHATITGTAVEKEKGTTYYEIESRDGSVSRDLLFLPDGTIAEIEERIAPADLPASVRAAVTSAARGWRVSGAERTIRGSDTTYDVVARTGARRAEFSVSPDGVILNRPGASKTATPTSQHR